jgi:hypothetical protein
MENASDTPLPLDGETSQCKIYGWFSPAIHATLPHREYIYERPDGSRVAVCGVQDTEGPPNCGDPCAVMMGEVTRLIESITFHDDTAYGMMIIDQRASFYQTCNTIN